MPVLSALVVAAATSNKITRLSFFTVSVVGSILPLRCETTTRLYALTTVPGPTVRPRPVRRQVAGRSGNIRHPPASVRLELEPQAELHLERGRAKSAAGQVIPGGVLHPPEVGVGRGRVERRPVRRLS